VLFPLAAIREDHVGVVDVQPTPRRHIDVDDSGLKGGPIRQGRRQEEEEAKGNLKKVAKEDKSDRHNGLRFDDLVSKRRDGH
jgi:hypothetical protein